MATSLCIALVTFDIMNNVNVFVEPEYSIPEEAEEERGNRNEHECERERHDDDYGQLQ